MKHHPARKRADFHVKCAHQRAYRLGHEAVAPSVIAGSVRSAAFIATQHSYVVDTPLGSLAATAPSFGSDALRAVGSDVTLQWPFEAAIVVRE